MTAEQILSFSISTSAVLLMSLAGVLALGVAMEAETRVRRLIVPGLYLLIIAINCVTGVISARDVTLLGIDPSFVPGPPNPVIKLIVRLAAIVTLTACGARIMAAWFGRENREQGGAGLFVAFCVFFVTNITLSSALGAKPQFTHDVYYSPFLFAAVFASRSQDPELATRLLRSGLLVFLGTSCVVAVVAPEIALQEGYSSWLPGVTVRLWGLATSPNTLGPLALLFLLLVTDQPFERRWLHYVTLAVGMLVFVLAQSKTAWLAAAVAIPTLLALRSRLLSVPSATRRARATLRAGLTVTLVLAGGTLAVFAFLVLPQLGVPVDQVLAPVTGDEVATLTGRDAVWSVALHEWMRSPYFGYGVTIWDAAYRTQIGMDHATSAHNQFLQSLSVAGVVGLMGLLIYVASLSFYAINAWRPTRGLSVALLTVVLVRSITETPLVVESFLSPELLTQLLLFHLALVHGHRATPIKRFQSTLVVSARGP